MIVHYNKHLNLPAAAVPLLFFIFLGQLLGHYYTWPLLGERERERGAERIDGPSRVSLTERVSNLTLAFPLTRSIVERLKQVVSSPVYPQILSPANLPLQAFLHSPHPQMATILSSCCSLCLSLLVFLFCTLLLHLLYPCWCGPHSYYSSYARCSFDHCANIYDGERPCSLRSYTTCVCTPGYVHQDSDKLFGPCFPVTDCPNWGSPPNDTHLHEGAVCGTNAYYTHQSPPCPRNCENYHEKEPVSGHPDYATISCACAPGYVFRSGEEGDCVLISQCEN